MVHAQEPFAWLTVFLMYSYFTFAIWFLKHSSTGKDGISASAWMPASLSYMVDKGLKIALAIFWIVVVFMNGEYRLRLDPTGAHPPAVTKVDYFYSLQVVGVIATLALGGLKNTFSFVNSFADPKLRARKVKMHKTLALVTVSLWFLFYVIWQICFIMHVKLTGMGEVQIANKIAVAALVFIGASYSFSLMVVGDRAINFVDTSDDLTGDFKIDRPAIGTTPGYLVEVANNWLYIAVFNLLSMYTWTVVFNDVGRLMVVIALQQFVTMYAMHWSGDWKAWMELFIFNTTNISVFYMFSPGVIMRDGFIDTAIPAGDYRHLQFMMDDANTQMQFDTGVMNLNQLAITSIALILGSGCFFVAALGAKRLANEKKSVVVSAAVNVPRKVGISVMSMVDVVRG